MQQHDKWDLRCWQHSKVNYYDLNQIKRLIKTLGMVNSQPDFIAHPKVINGFSALMQGMMGNEYGIGTRTAVGMMLPNNVAVEIEANFECYCLCGMNNCIRKEF